MEGTAVAKAEHRVEWGKGRRIAFYTAVVLSLASLAVTGLLLTLPVSSWLPEATLNAMFGREDLAIHRLHAQGTGLFFWLTIVAMIAQIRRPEAKAAPLWAAAAAMVVLLPLDWTNVFDPLSLTFAVPVLAVLSLHPNRWPTGPIVWRPGPTLVATPFAVVAVAYAYQQALLQINGLPQDPHMAGSHYALMAAMAVGLGVSALLGATNFPGHLISAWTTGLMTISLGVFSIAYPEQSSSVGIGWGTAIVVWSLVYLVVTTRTTRAQGDQQVGIAS